MTLREFLEDNFFNLPLTYKGDYKSYITNFLNKEFLSKIRSLKNSSNSLEPSNLYNIDFIVGVQERLISGLIDAVEKIMKAILIRPLKLSAWL